MKFDRNHTVISFVPFLEYAELAKSVMPAMKVCRAVPFPTVEKHNCPILLFNSTETISKIFEHIGFPIIIENESLVGFSPRKAEFALYIANFEGKEDLLTKFGKHKTAKACVYIKKLEDVNVEVLKKLITGSIKHYQAKYK